MAEYTRRRAPGAWHDKPTLDSPIDAAFLEGVEVALDKLLGKDTPAVDEVGVWTPGSGGLIYQKVGTNQLADGSVTNVKLAANAVDDTKVVAGAAIAYAKLALGGKVKLDTDVDAATALAIARLAGFPNDATKRLAGDGNWVNATIAPTLLTTGAVGNRAVAVANTAYLAMIPGVVTPTSISRLVFLITVVVAGNYDVGIFYSDDEATFTRVVSKGSTAQPAAGQIFASVGATTLTPVTGRRWYLALALSSASTIGWTDNGGIASGVIPGFSKAASFPLPASLTGMTTAPTVPAMSAVI